MKMLTIVGLGTALLITGAGFQDIQVSAVEKFPACTSEKVLRKLVKRFNKTERIYWQDGGWVLHEVRNPHRHSANPFPGSPINRHYCHGDAVFENGKKRRVHFLIEQGAGFAGFTWNVEYCVHGLDRWRYHDGFCRVLSR